MGKTAFDGPVYGAKATLLSLSKDAVSTGPALTVRVPPYEDWYVTELQIHRQSTGSTVFGASLLDDSTVVSSVTLTSSLADLSTWAGVTPDGGEYEGARIAAGSVVSISLNSTGVHTNVLVRGFTRFIDSTRPS